VRSVEVLLEDILHELQSIRHEMELAREERRTEVRFDPYDPFRPPPEGIVHPYRTDGS
jgi:hypothetical protein